MFFRLSFIACLRRIPKCLKFWSSVEKTRLLISFRDAPILNFNPSNFGLAANWITASRSLRPKCGLCQLISNAPFRSISLSLSRFIPFAFSWQTMTMASNTYLYPIPIHIGIYSILQSGDSNMSEFDRKTNKVRNSIPLQLPCCF